MSSSEELRFVSPAGTPDYTEVDEAVQQEVDRGDPFYVSELSLSGDKFLEIFSNSNYTSSAFPPSPFNFAVNCVSGSNSEVGAEIIAGCPLAASSLLPPLSSTATMDDLRTVGEGVLEGMAGSGLEGAGSYASVTAWILVLIMTFLIVVTIVGNVLVCLSVILVRKLRKPQNYLLVSLATSDLFVALFVMPFAIIVEFHEGQWPLNPALCDLWVSVDVLCCTASILNLCGISVDRYQAITAPFDYSARSTPRRMLSAIFIVWLGSACVSLPPLLLFGNDHIAPDHTSICRVSQNFWYQIYATMASFYVPLCVIVVVYVKILRIVADKKKEMTWKQQSQTVGGRGGGPTPSPQHLPPLNPTTTPSTHLPNSLLKSQQSSTTLSGKAGHPTTKLTHKNSTSSSSSSTLAILKRASGAGSLSTSGGSTATNANGAGGFLLPSVTLHRIKKERFFGGLKEHKASTTLGIIMSAFIICWLPFFVLALVRPLFRWEIPGWVTSLFNWLGWANSALNPVIYATLNRDFRRPFKEILCFRCATLDSLMRKEFYHQQYGDDMVNLRNKQSIPIDSDAEPPTSL